MRSAASRHNVQATDVVFSLFLFADKLESHYSILRCQPLGLFSAVGLFKKNAPM